MGNSPPCPLTSGVSELWALYSTNIMWGFFFKKSSKKKILLIVYLAVCKDSTRWMKTTTASSKVPMIQGWDEKRPHLQKHLQCMYMQEDILVCLSEGFINYRRNKLQGWTELWANLSVCKDSTRSGSTNDENDNCVVKSTTTYLKTRRDQSSVKKSRRWL